ncbi:MAG TPA: 3,4-dehydroadipyl-CoA semialdehyde dehydrogenase [Planctomycetota bacterium]|nr:3,4-dehydroadipyl-CoA semialdehyde dehydrogenase [Planctomycetota bacterium]
MSEVLENYVRGRWQAGKAPLADLHDPTTGEVIARASTGGIDMKGALDWARDVGGKALRAMTFAQRAEMLLAASKAIHAHRDALLEVGIRNGGNTRKDAKFDVDGAIGTLAAYADWGKKLGDTDAMLDGEGIQLGRTPRLWGQHVLLPRHGVAVHVNAFNFPAWGLAEKAACAWLAGMPVVSKPATATAMLAERVVRVLVDAKVLPEGALSLLCGSAGDLLDHMTAQDVLAFTGSADTGYLLRSKERLLRRSVRVNVEADSLNSAVLGPDVEPGTETWNLFLRDVVTDMTQKAGQKCTAIRRVLVPAARLADVEADLKERLTALKIGHPGQEGVGMGPLSTASQLRDAKAGVTKLLAESTIVFGTLDEPALVGATPGAGWFLSPVLLRTKDASAAKTVHEHEVFGPVSTLLPWDGTPAAAADLVRKGEGSLVASVFSDDRDFVRQMIVAIGPWHGRLYLGSEHMAGQSPGPGTVLPGTIHGGPGRAGGGEELGAFRGLALYQQRVALEGDRAAIEKMFPPK